ASSTLCMGNLEPWMDHEYTSQVIRLMGWERLSTNNGTQDTSIIIKIPPSPPDVIPQPNNPGYCLLTFPTAAQAASVLASLHSVNSKDPAGAPLLMPNSSHPFNLQWANPSQVNAASQGPQREYSIFVGDLAPETSNSDLVAVEPKFIRPFYSCKSAKIMLDPVTGISRGYGFVRFTEEADQQRALIEMHGLYCLSRPSDSSSLGSQPPPYSGQTGVLGANAGGFGPAGIGSMYDEAWTHQVQARAILGNLIGPNGEQLTSTDPYNTTVFVGGLSPLISEETLRTFFAPFGDIHYVKVPLGKHCGFVQFVRKADAERAIDRMQGFPIGGSRIRLSWGRSQ
ncbi:hypothetical protein BU17DRAFT_13787, partial [Hysterangium stoloniferum]